MVGAKSQSKIDVTSSLIRIQASVIKGGNGMQKKQCSDRETICSYFLYRGLNTCNQDAVSFESRHAFNM